MKEEQKDGGIEKDKTIDINKKKELKEQCS